MTSYIGNKKIKDFYLSLGKSQGVLNNPEKITGITLTQDPLNATLTGSVNVANGGILSNFSQSNYATLPYAINGNSNFEVVFKIKITDANSTWTNILGNGTKDWTTAIHFFINASGSGFKIRLEATSNNTSWNLCNLTGNTVLKLNTWYWLKATRIKSGSNILYTIYYSTDGTTYTQDGQSSTSTTGLKGSISIVGTSLSHSDLYIRGSIDFSQSYIKKDDVIVWRGGSRSSSITLHKGSYYYLPIGKSEDYTSDEEILEKYSRPKTEIKRILNNDGFLFLEVVTTEDITSTRNEQDAKSYRRSLDIGYGTSSVSIDATVDNKLLTMDTFNATNRMIYNSSTNFIRYVAADGIEPASCRSFPFGYVYNDSNNRLVYGSIDYILNSVTWIGRNVFTLPGFTVLIPNGLVNGCEYSNIEKTMDTVGWGEPISATIGTRCFVSNINGKLDFCFEDIYSESGNQPTTTAYFWWNNISNKFNQKWYSGSSKNNSNVCFILKATSSTANYIDSIEINYTKDTVKKLKKLYNGKSLIFNKS